MRLRWLAEAADDLEEIFLYLKANRPELAESTVDEIYDAVLSLEEFPLRGRPSRKSGVRELVLPRLPYIAFYRINDDSVEVLYIRHGARNRSMN